MRLIPDDTWAVLTIRGEGAGEPFVGKVAIGITIRNRMRLRYSSDGTVVGTVLRPHQFSMWNYPRNWVATSDDEDYTVRECIQAWEESEGSTLLPGDVVLYHTAQKPANAKVWPPTWAAPMRFVRQVGAHLFYADPTITKG